MGRHDENDKKLLQDSDLWPGEILPMKNLSQDRYGYVADAVVSAVKIIGYNGITYLYASIELMQEAGWEVD